MITHEPAMCRLQRIQRCLKRLYLRAKLMKFRALRFMLGLKVCGVTLKYRVLGGDEPKSLLGDRRRAVFVDEFFQKLKHAKA